MRALRRGVAEYVDSIERTHWGALALNRLWPAYVFSFLVAAKVISLREGLLDLPAQATIRGEWGLVAWLTHQTFTTFFLSVVVILFLIRKPIVGPRSDLLGAVVAIAGTFALWLLIMTPVEQQPWPLLVLASVLIVVGTTLALISLLTLGRHFGLFPEARGLVTTGPYRWMRHPVYTGELVAALGLVLPVASPRNLLVFALLCGLQYWRAVNEERAIETVFPEYRGYRARTWRLVPWLH